METPKEIRAAMLTRQMDLIPAEILNTRVTVIGAGAIGSFTVLSLAKMGFADISVFDSDIISIENMNCQFFPMGAIGEKKVEALRDLVEVFTGTKIRAVAENYAGPREATEDFGPFPGMVITAVDSMAARRLAWENHKGKLNTQWFIDPRMGGEYAQLYTVNPMDADDRAFYEKTLFSDADATPERCTARATIYTALMLSGHVCKNVKDVLTKEPNYARYLDWNIKHNAFTPWTKKKETK